MEYIVHIVIVIGIYVILASSLNLVAGYTGYFSIAHAALYGVGAYTTAILSTRVGSPFLLNLVFSAMLGAALGMSIGAISLRTRADCFTIVTFGVQVIVFSLMMNVDSVTGGPMGITNIPRAWFLGQAGVSTAGFMVTTVFFASLAQMIIFAVVSSRFGKVLIAIREDEILCQTMGRDVSLYKTTVFVASGAMASVAGGLYGAYIGFVDPSSFTIMESIFIISIVIIGGTGNLWGPVLGAVVLVTLPELLRFVGIPSAAAANIRQILYGLALVACMLWRPQGLIGEYAFGRETKPQ
jgi:branched-chain amino acid transport system permease protein